MSAEYDDEVLPITPTDVATPFIFQPGVAAPTLFTTTKYPTQGGQVREGKAGELRGLYGGREALMWRPDWSDYMADRPTKKHFAVDIYAPPGTKMIAVVGGELSFGQHAAGLGLYARLRFSVQGKTYEFHYGHLGAAVGAPRSVSKGEVIGEVGCSGNANNTKICATPVPPLNFTSSHVHFALLPPQELDKPKRSNPLTVLGWQLVTPSKPAGVNFSG